MTANRTAVILLASGRSSRFEDGDKLLADFCGAPLIVHAARHVGTERAAHRIAIVGSGQSERAQVMASEGYTCLTNPDPDAGQGRSLALAAAHVRDNTPASCAFILLGDMPCIPQTLIAALEAAIDAGAEAAMAQAEGISQPPAIFTRPAFDSLAALDGDAGARSLFKGLHNTALIDAASDALRDIDTRADLAFAREAVNA